MPDTCTRRDLGALAVSCFVLRLPALISSRWFDPDEAAIAVQARTIVAGGRLYVDMADRKPPIPPMLYAAWFDLTNSNDPRGPRLIASLLLAIAAVALTTEVSRTYGRRVALWTGALYVVSCFAFTPADGAAANYTHLAVPLATLALLACRRGGRFTLFGGFFLGLAILTRQSWIFAVPAGALSCWMSSRLRGTATYAVGLFAGVATAALMAPWSDYWFWNFKTSTGFVFASIGVGHAVGVALASIGLFTAYHLALVAGAARQLRSSERRSSGRRQLDLWVWVATGLAATAAGFRFFGHYWMQVVPPLVLLAGPAVASCARPWRRVAGASLALTASLATVSQCAPTLFRERPDPASLATSIRSCTSSDDRVFVWGSYPELLVAVDRPAAGRMVHSDFVTGRSGGRKAATDAATPGAQQRMMDDLRADPPAVVVDTSGSADLGYEAFPLFTNPELDLFVHEGYIPVAADGGVVLWWRFTSPCADSPNAPAS